MLEREQAAIAATLLHGPDDLPGGLFAGDDAAVLRGLCVHANTISHARLVALEETFPRTRAHLGDAEFNRLSRIFVEGGGAEALALPDIGRDFAGWLDDPLAADVARVEWAWLESYNAAEAPPLRLADLAGQDEAALLALTFRLHPAAQVVTLASDAAPLVDPALASGTGALLVVRPDAEVRLLALHVADDAALDRAKEISTLGNLIAVLAELHPDGGAAIATLIDAGAFERF
ncbi:DNA-binding domain-containing protein [Sphingopyxis sp. BSN-002]|uniref:HvfC/BufC family peptide modification chaperone n=1 Tax=Sphingopyxis sp. BSN-002 TaxID=2911495 RepID=UPI001EDB39CC|nr:putative DNA-binding domain-containing protein [Sphingopyxis sp. BSN-002]UKK83896.1 DNA-binding domain-containing protein [Sphingopyxis sp. BSN-002]